MISMALAAIMAMAHGAAAASSAAHPKHLVMVVIDGERFESALPSAIRPHN